MSPSAFHSSAGRNFSPWAPSRRACASPRLTRPHPPGRYNPLSGGSTVAYLTVLPAGSSAASLAAAAAKNSPLSPLNAALAAAAAQSAAMRARLDAVQPLLQTLQAEPAPSLTVPGMSTTAPVLWAGTPLQMCYVLPPSESAGPKALVLYGGAGWWGPWYPGALGAGTAPLPAAARACVAFSLPATLPPGTYTVGLQDSAGVGGGGGVAVTTTFSVGSGVVYFSGLVPGPAAVALSVSWSVDAAHASARDLVRVVGPTGAAVHWFYTACQCQTTPGAGAAAVASGTASFQLALKGAAKGVYTPVLLPGGGGLPAMSGANWIPWAGIGL